MLCCWQTVGFDGSGCRVSVRLVGWWSVCVALLSGPVEMSQMWRGGFVIMPGRYGRAARTVPHACVTAWMSSSHRETAGFENIVFTIFSFLREVVLHWFKLCPNPVVDMQAHVWMDKQTEMIKIIIKSPLRALTWINMATSKLIWLDKKQCRSYKDKWLIIFMLKHL